MADVYDGPGLLNYSMAGSSGYAPSAGGTAIAPRDTGRRWGPPQRSDAPPPMPQGSPYGGPGGYYQGQGYFGDDPFGYTNGSILTPWTQPFQAPPGSGGGYSPPEFQPFNYADFNYNYRPPEGFGERYNTADPFYFREFTPAASFKPPTEADMKSDPGYQARLKQGQRALEASKAAQGVLKTGGTAKAIQNYGQETASQEYDKVYGRRQGEQATRYGQGLQTYTTQRGNAFENYQANEANRNRAYQTREGAWKDNADVSLRGSELGYNVAQGSWDRNYAKARQGYDDEQAARQAAASAAAANSSQSYNRALDEYKMAYDIFQNNQSNQFNRLVTLGGMGMDAAGQQGRYGAAYGDAASSIYGQAANANASARVASGNAWNNALTGIGNTALDIGMYSAMNRPSAARPATPSYMGYGTQIPPNMTLGTIRQPARPVATYSGVPSLGNPHG